MRIVPRLSTISRELTSSPRRALHASRTVVTMLPSSPHVRNVYVEEDGIISALRALPPEIAQSTLCIDSTTLDVEVARDVAAEVERAGAAIVDAPVSGGVTGARAATLSFLVAGLLGIDMGDHFRQPPHVARAILLPPDPPEPGHCCIYLW